MEEKEMTKLLKLQVKLLSALLAVVAVCALALGIQSYRMWQVMSAVDSEAVSAAVDSLQRTAAELEKLDVSSMQELAASISAMSERMGKLDVDALNDSLRAMSSAVENLQKLDAQHLNDLISSLQKTASTFDRFSSLFK